ncbi:MAG: c-type cytochrome [Burkholderiales bacterium]|nr:c-type cytochrome [Burkholderiales bacterium]
MFPITPAVIAAAVLAALVGPAQGETRVERGRYLTESIVACGNCHTPQGPDGPLPGMALAGGLKIEDKPFTAYASNITPDKATGIGRWTDAQIIAAIREGRRPDGSIIGPPMPIGLYRDLSDSDVRAIVAYLRTVKPVRNQVQKSAYRMPLPPSYGPPVGKVPDVPRADKVAYGRYLAGPAGHCVECHSPPGPNGAPDLANKLGAGGFSFYGPWGTSVSTNITPAGIGRLSDAELKKVITTGVRPDGSRLKPPMGVSYYARMRSEDLDAVVAYLRSLPVR